MTASLYERVGGEAFFYGLVERFYVGIESDPVLRPMYPADLNGPQKRLSWFLIQTFGGPALYDKRRGEPKMRFRHLRFPIDRAARDAWMGHMTEAVRATSDDDGVRNELLDYFSTTATFFINRGLAIGGNS